MDLGPRRCLVCLADRILPETASATRAAATLGASCSQTRMMVHPCALDVGRCRGLAWCWM